MGAVRRGLRVLGSVAVATATLSVVAGVGALPAHAAPTSVVVPNANTTSEGNGNNAFPFDCASGDPTSMRYQQVYAAAQVGSGTISQVAFRDGTFPSTVIPKVTITLSTTTKPVTGLSTTFADNIGADVKTVFSGDLTLSGSAPSSFPGPFDITIPLQQPFSYNSTGGNLLLDVTIPTCKRTDAFDADFQSQPSPISMARVYAVDSSASSGQGDSPGQFGGLVTQFTLGAGPTVHCDHTTTGTSGTVIAGSTGTTCVSGATINGSVVANNGATLVISDSTIHGSVVGSNPSKVSLCGNKVDNNISFTSASGFVLIGGDGAGGCPGNTVGGSVSLQSNNGGLRLAGNHITGSVSLSSNHASGTDPVVGGPAGNVVSHNTIGASLSCSGDVPPASNGGTSNTVGGTRSGECAGPTF